MGRPKGSRNQKKAQDAAIKIDLTKPAGEVLRNYEANQKIKLAYMQGYLDAKNRRPVPVDLPMFLDLE